MLLNGAQNNIGTTKQGGETLRSQCCYVELEPSEVPAVDELISELGAARREDRIPDVLLLPTYTPCLAVGARRLDENDLLKPLDFFSQHGIPLYKTVRGGGLTFHWPGQFVCYPILKLAPEERNIPQYMFSLEEIALKTLADLGLQAGRKRENTAQIGLWIADDKIASMGIRVSHWVTSHGFAVNLSGDASMSHYIKPCGLNVNLVTVEEKTGVTPSRAYVRDRAVLHFSEIMHRSFVPLGHSDSPAHNQIRKILLKYGIRPIGE